MSARVNTKGTTTQTEAACGKLIAASPQLSHVKTQALQAAPGDAL